MRKTGKLILNWGFVLFTLAIPAFAGPPPIVPELDPGSIASALTLLIGTVLILKDRKGRK